MNFSERLKKARKYRGYTQAELAKKCGLATGTIQQYELGKRYPTAKNLHKIAEQLELSYAFTKTGEVYFYDFIDTISNKEQIENEKFNQEQYNTINNNQLILDLLNKLNEKGQRKALEQIELLTKIKEYLR